MPTELPSASDPRATSIRLLDFRSAPMRAFHMAWMAFLVCFFAWFGIAPLMPVVRQELHLTESEVGWCIIGSVGTTIFARLVAGWLCDRFGPRITYSALLVFGALPVIGIGLSGSFASFLAFRMMIGLIGASFVITQVHASLMFAPRCVGTANALAASASENQATWSFAKFIAAIVRPQWAWTRVWPGQRPHASRAGASTCR